MKNELVGSKLVSDMTSDVNVGMDEVVNVFVSRYEDDLHERKKALSKELSVAKANLGDFIKTLETELRVKGAGFEFNIIEFGLSGAMSSSKICWTETDLSYSTRKHKSLPKNYPFGCVEIRVQSFSDDGSLDQYKFIELETSDLDQHTELKQNVVDISTELKSILEMIKDVSRKERQIRGKISAAKLEKAGYDDLLQNDELLQLVQIS